MGLDLEGKDSEYNNKARSMVGCTSGRPFTISLGLCWVKSASLSPVIIKILMLCFPALIGHICPLPVPNEILQN